FHLWNLWLKELLLGRGFARGYEPGGVEGREAGVAEAGTGLAETLLEQLREWAFAAHAGAEGAVVVLAAAHLLDQAHHVRGALGVVQLQPLAPDLLQLVRQAQQHVAGRARAVLARGFEDVLHL